MWQTPIIKQLRQNFIRKHRDVPDCYFSENYEVYASDPFTDRGLFHPNDTLRRKGTAHDTAIKIKLENNTHGHQKQDEVKSSRITVRLNISRNSEKRVPSSKDLRSKNVNFQSNQQPTFVKAVKAKSRVNSASKSLHVSQMPAHSRYLMMPCMIQSIKITPRPCSAISDRYRSTDSKVSLKARPRVKKQIILEPWQTAEDELFML